MSQCLVGWSSMYLFGYFDSVNLKCAVITLHLNHNVTPGHEFTLLMNPVKTINMQIRDFESHYMQQIFLTCLVWLYQILID